MKEHQPARQWKAIQKLPKLKESVVPRLTKQDIKAVGLNTILTTTLDIPKQADVRTIFKSAYKKRVPKKGKRKSV